jgi:hypothetical protein
MFFSARSPRFLVVEIELARDLGMHLAREADAAGFGQLLQPHRQIDAIAVEIAVFDDDLAEVDPDAQLERESPHCAGVAVGHRLLQIDGGIRPR